MNKTQLATVVKSVGGVFTVMDDNGVKTTCFSPKKFRYNDEQVLVGDVVRFESLGHGKGVICDVLPRKNCLCRPQIANVDVCFLVLACQPQPDYYLADKVLINCFQEQIEPIIVVNKMDIDSKTLQEVKDNYHLVAQVVDVCSQDETVLKLAPYLQNKIACFAGQSAVGKTSILNALLGDEREKVGGISAKSGRGTHTTRHSSLHKVLGGYLVDTCGFSLCDLVGIRADELRLYLDDFVQVAHDCKYTSCSHTVEPQCAVKQAVASGDLCASRYQRYLEEYNELKTNEKNQY